MSALPQQRPALIDFPDPRNAPSKRREKISMPKPSVESILHQISKGSEKPPEETKKPSDDPESVDEAEKEEFRKERREVARLQSESMERMRVARELEVLLAAREKVLDNREAQLRELKTTDLPQSDISSMERSLKDVRKVMEEASQTLARMESIISGSKNINTINSGGSSSDNAEGKQVNDYEDIKDASLADQVAFLKEREAYVEKSENVLFEKAQHLQEWETRLEQMDDDRQGIESES